VLACHLPPPRRNHLEVMADRLGFGEGFLATGFVPEDALVLLNQAADLLVMPSLHEGFGFPVAEALACGTPAIGSDRTSIPELLPADGLFDPTDVPAAATAIERALTDGDHRRALLAWAARPRRTWHDVARGTIESYDRLPSEQRTARAARPGRPRVGFVTPLPPQPGGVADYSHRLLEELREVLDVTALVDGPPHHRAEMLRAEAPDGVIARPLAALDRIEGLCRPFDAVVWSLGNSEFHTGALAGLLRRRRGIVLAHDVRLTNLYRFAAWQHPDAVPGGFAATLQRLYDGRLPAALGAGGSIADRDADTWGVLMAADVVGACDRFLATSDFAATLARLDARAADRSKVGVLPFSVGAIPLASPTPAERRPGPPLVATFGVVNARKLAGVVIDAFAAATDDQRQARLVFVGPASEADAAAVRRAAGEAGIGGRVELTGEVDEDGYRRWLDRAWVAVQLRAATNGESSGAIGDCLTAGVPTVVTAIGPNRAIPTDAAVGVPAGADASIVAGELRSLLTSTDRRAALSAGARRYAAAHSFRRAAEALAAEVAAFLGR
jgi:glycosyltransferase involved in cell wall biosynthesis